MVPFQVDPSWYERYWLDEQPTRRRRLSLSTLIEAAKRIARVPRPTQRAGGQDPAAGPSSLCSEHQAAMPISSFAPRTSRIKLSPASLLRSEVQARRAAGRDIIALNSGDLDFPTPDHVIAAAHAAALRGETKYTTVDGTPALKDAVRVKFRRDNGLDYGPDEVMVANGSTQVIFNAFFATVAAGDEVIVPRPSWEPYLDQVRLVGGEPVLVPCAQNNGFKLTPEDLDAAITRRTRWVVINNPNNPTGAVYSHAELAGLADVLLRHPSVHVLADDLYEHIVFDGRRCETIAAVEPRLKARTLTVNGVAKAYAMMGWHIGYGGGPAALIREMVKLQSQSTSAASSIGQAAAVAALTGPQDVLSERTAALARRRDAFVAHLNRCPGLTCPYPEGTFYLFVSCAGLIGTRTPAGKPIRSDRDVAAYLLEAADVAVVPGEDCGLSPYFRGSFAYASERLSEAGARIERACLALRDR
jgi:aspartate aminotransferase